MPRLPVDEIRKLHDEIEADVRSHPKAIRIGELLTGVRAGLVHGQWEKWFADNLAAKFCIRTARNYLKAYEDRDLVKTARVADLADPSGDPQPGSKAVKAKAEQTHVLRFSRKDFGDISKLAAKLLELCTDITTKEELILKALRFAKANSGDFNEFNN